MAKVELATKKSSTHLAATCGLAAVLPGGHRIEAHPDFGLNTFERFVSVLKRCRPCLDVVRGSIFVARSH